MVKSYKSKEDLLEALNKLYEAECIEQFEFDSINQRIKELD